MCPSYLQKNGLCNRLTIKHKHLHCQQEATNAVVYPSVLSTCTMESGMSHLESFSSIGGSKLLPVTLSLSLTGKRNKKMNFGYVYQKGLGRRDGSQGLLLRL